MRKETGDFLKVVNGLEGSTQNALFPWRALVFVTNTEQLGLAEV